MSNSNAFVMLVYNTGNIDYLYISIEEALDLARNSACEVLICFENKRYKFYNGEPKFSVITRENKENISFLSKEKD